MHSISSCLAKASHKIRLGNTSAYEVTPWKVCCVLRTYLEDQAWGAHVWGGAFPLVDHQGAVSSLQLEALHHLLACPPLAAEPGQLWEVQVCLGESQAAQSWAASLSPYWQPSSFLTCLQFLAAQTVGSMHVHLLCA
jgi:hypothetical protein